MKIAPVILFLLTSFAVATEAFDNVLLISIDTLRADHLSCYGSTRVKTPHIDSLARSGVLFKNAVSPAPYTLPSHVSMMTGLIPPVHGVLDNSGFYLSSNIVTLAEVFHSKGMKTGAFLGAFPLDSRFGMDQGFDAYDDTYAATKDGSSILMLERPAEEVTRQALDWLQTQKNSRWFAFVHYYDPHFPYKDSYEAEIAQVDTQVGVLLDFLQKYSLAGKTLIVLTSDHGESLGEHQEKTHGVFAYESTLRIPLIISPFRPKIIADRVRLIDVAPTILALQKLSFSTRVQGVSLVKLLGGGTEEIPDAYFESLSMHLTAGWAPLRGFYSGHMKYIDLPVRELYDMNTDPKELKNLCSDHQICNVWQSKFNMYYRPFQQAEIRPAQMDRETMEHLRALGYVTGESKERQEQYTSKDDPKNLIPFHNRVDEAIAYFNKGYELKALEILEKIIEERPDYSAAYEHASFIRNSLGFPDQAVDLLQKAVRSGIHNDMILGKLGLYLYLAKRYDEAIKQLNVAIQASPGDIDNINHLGMAYTSVGKYVEAEDAFRKALEVDPSNAMTLSNIGRLYLAQKKMDLAEKQFEAAIAANPHLPEPYTSLGVIHAGRRNWDEAIRNWNLALNKNSKNFDVMLKLALAYLEKNETEKALKLLQQFEKGAPPARYSGDLVKVRLLIQKLQ